MKLFLLFLFGSFFGGIYFWNRPAAWRIILLAVVSAFICYAYLYLDQI